VDGEGNTVASKTIEIVQNGDSFLVVHGEDKLPLIHDEKSGTMKMGPFQSISYLKTSDTLLLSDGSELQRAK
jgi:hypothetical protein